MKIVTFLFVFIALQSFAQQSEFNYPLETGDIWEYLELDGLVPTCACPSPSRVSAIKEVLGDTLMPNGLTYKIIRKERCSNTTDNTPSYEFQRIDSNKVFIFHNNKDWVLYNFNLQINDSYPSHIDSCIWKFTMDYKDSDSSKIFVFELFKKTNEYSFLTIHIKDSIGVSHINRMDGDNWDSALTSDYFGGVFNNKVHNYPLAFDKNIDWKEFYPLQIGNLWIYNVREGFFNSTTVVKVLGDTVMPDMQKYSIMNEINFGGPHPNNSIVYRRIDSSGSIFNWNTIDSKATICYKFSACAGDTFYPRGLYFRSLEKNSKGKEILYYILLDNKYENNLTFKIESLETGYDNFKRGTGLSYSSWLSGSQSLRGSIINGVVNGDTTLVGINDEILNMPDDFYLAQNYPNPFNPSTTINYNIKEEGLTSLRIYNSLGEEIKTLVNEVKSPGTYQTTFTGNELSSGIYFYVLSSGNNISSKKMILIK